VKQNPAVLENKGLAGCSTFLNCQRWDNTSNLIIVKFGESSLLNIALSVACAEEMKSFYKALFRLVSLQCPPFI
jgi:hypothetical protein